MNAGHIYVALSRLEKAVLMARQGAAGSSDGRSVRGYELTPAGQERVTDWLAERIADMQCRELLRRLRGRGLRKDYQGSEGLVRVDGIDLEIARGETLAVMGPSGCGKLTLLHLLGGPDRPSLGELWLAGRRIERLSERALAHVRREEVGFVFQAGVKHERVKQACLLVSRLIASRVATVA